ncbi:MAG: hypothetical protein ABFR53_05955, partial [Actinomycetota bacterium]
HTCTNRCTYRRRWEDQIVFIESRLPHDSLIDSSHLLGIVGAHVDNPSGSCRSSEPEFVEAG